MNIGLALGGGGARGLAHITLLEAFDELGVKPSLIVGCSMGAIVGALYASGMTAADIRAHATHMLSNRLEFLGKVFGRRAGYRGNLLTLWGFKALQLDGLHLTHLALPPDVPAQMEQLPIKFKTVTVNYHTQEEILISSGSVHEAVALSIAIPGLIAAPRVGGQVYVDGGVKNPVPFDHARRDITVAIDVTGKPKNLSDERLPSNIELAAGSLLIMFNELAELRCRQSPPEIYITADLPEFGPADFFKLSELLEAAQPAKEQLKRALHAQLEQR